VLEQAGAALRTGGLLVYPTETLYALGGRALDGDAAARVREAKGRAEDKALPLIAADPQQARGLFETWPEAAETLAERFWPGPLTLVLPASAAVPREVLARGNSIGVRVPGRELPRRLCRAAGPLIATSANRSGEPPATRCADALAAIGAWVTMALDGGICAGAPSTIVDLCGVAPRVLREGAIPRTVVLAALG
jgi:L-threonylcarbamoyladenylate synthase